VSDREIIAKNLEVLIKSSGKSQVEIAFAVGVKESAISSYLVGRTIPSTLVVKRLCQVLDCNYEDILGRL